MIMTKILFLVLILVCAAFYILYVWDFSLVLLIAVSALPVIMFITTYITKRLITVEFAVKDSTNAKNTDIPVQLVVNNRSLFPVGKAEAHVEYYNLFGGQVSSFDLHLPIQPRNSQRITFQLRSKFCGVIRIKAAYLNIYDPLRIFKFRAAKNTCTEIAVMPEGYDISGIVHYSDRVNEESDTFSEHRPGDDPSEVFDLREYYPGDKLNRIHWKLSSKKNEFIVKEYSLPIDVPCSVFLDLKCSRDSELKLAVCDTLIEAFLSLSQLLLENERAHSVTFYSSSQGCFVNRNVNDTGDLPAVIHEILSNVSDESPCHSAEEYFAENPSLSFASFTFITSSADRSILDHIDENVDADFKNAVIIADSVKEADSFGQGSSSLCIIPVVVGRISASIKDIDV